MTLDGLIVKILSVDDSLFFRGEEIAAQFKGSPVIEVGKSRDADNNEYVVIVMEKIEGRTLLDDVNLQGTLDEKELLKVIIEDTHMKDSELATKSTMNEKEVREVRNKIWKKLMTSLGMKH